jgi:hypothetical protein
MPARCPNFTQFESAKIAGGGGAKWWHQWRSFPGPRMGHAFAGVQGATTRNSWIQRSRTKPSERLVSWEPGSVQRTALDLATSAAISSKADASSSFSTWLTTRRPIGSWPRMKSGPRRCDPESGEQVPRPLAGKILRERRMVPKQEGLEGARPIGPDDAPRCDAAPATPVEDRAGSAASSPASEAPR